MPVQNQKVIEKLKDDPLMPLRHSAEHVLHTAMQELYPNLKKVMGPPIENGFYMDFDLDKSITPEDFEKIEERMQKIIDANLQLTMDEIDEDKAKEIFKNNEYKIDIINEIVKRGEKITVCELGKKDGDHHDLDICTGPHVKSTGKIKAFRLLSVAGAYYKGDENQKMLQRIYGAAFDSEDKLEKYLAAREFQRQNDHRELNKVLDIFATSDLVGKGLVMYTPKGTTIRNELRNHLMDICKKHGAQEVNIPHFAKIELFEKSGHAEKFKDELFKVTGHYDNEFVLKPVNCPYHTQIYASRPRSYRDLPIAYVESTQQHRDEKPGSMVGLNRLVSFEIDDGHTFCTPKQLKDEAIKLVETTKEFYKTFGMWGDHWVSLSFRDKNKPEDYIGSDEEWEKAQNLILEINDELGLEGKVLEGEAALYGPKIDIMYKNSLDNDQQLGTVQIDFAMPRRFGLTYTDKDGVEKTPVMIHRAILGSYNRFIAYLMESTGGAFPVWLAPTQAIVIPIGEKHVEYAQKVLENLKKQGIRAEINQKDETMQAKVRNAQIQKIPYMLIVGDREVQDKKISVRLRTGEDLGAQTLDSVTTKILQKISEKSLDL